MALHVLILHGDPVGAHDVAPNLGKGQAALLGYGGRFGLGGHPGVHENQRHDEFLGRLLAVELPRVLGLGLPQVDDAELDRPADLLGRQSDAGRFMHRLDHVVRQPGQRGIEYRDFIPLFAQDRLVVMNNSQQHGSMGAISVLFAFRFGN